MSSFTDKIGFWTILLFCAVFDLVAAESSPERTLHTFEEIEALSDDASAPHKVPMSVTGKVLSVSPTTKAMLIILSDEQGDRSEFYRLFDLDQPSPGDTIRVIGHAYLSHGLEPFLTIEDFELVEHGPCPEPVPVRLSETNTEKHHLMTIRTEGTVIDVFPDEMDRRFLILLLKDEGRFLPVSILLSTFGDRSDLVDARIRVTGVYHRFVSGIRKVAWPNIQPQTRADIEVIRPPPEDPFYAPPLENQSYLLPEDIMRMSRRSIRGEVLATWAGNRAMLRTDDGRIVNLDLVSGEKLPACGESIVAAGQPETDLFRINLSSVRWKPADTPVAAETNETITADTPAAFLTNDGKSYNGEAHGKFLSVEGIVRTLPAHDGKDLRFIVDTDILQVPVDVTSNPSVLDGLEIGTRIRVTGRGLLLADVWQPSNVFPKAKGVALVIRSPEDVIILSHPPWWTPARLLVLIAILLLTLAGVGAWNMIQRHLSQLKIAERTRLAVELHDSLSQNLAGVACQVAAGSNAIDEDPKTAKSRIKAAERMLQSCRTELRHCLFDLRSDMLEETDFKAAILKALNQLTDEVSVSIRFTAHRSNFTDPTAHAILSVIRELVANAIRHGHATSIRIAGCTDKGKLLFSVSDDGAGFDPRHCAGIADGHFGLSGIRDRLTRLDGTITFSSAPGRGTKATVTLPIPRT